jgi:hypothetical protein
MATTARERDRRPSSPSRISSILLTPRAVIALALAVIVAAIIVIGTQNDKTPADSGKITGATGGNGSHHGSGGKKHHGGTTTTSTSTIPTTTTPVVAKHATLKLVPTATVWICVENQAGKPLIAATDYTAGETIPSLRARQLLVTLGNAGVTMTADGKPYNLTAGSSAIALRITPTGVKTLSPAPTCQQ